MTNLWILCRRELRLTEKRSRFRSCRPGVEFFERRTLLSPVAWTGDAGTDDWDTPGNWSTNSLPGAGDDVTIGAGATVVHSDNDSDSINSLTSSGSLSITGGTLAIAAASTVDALTVDQQTNNPATLTVNGSLSVSGLLKLGHAALSGAGSITANGGIATDAADTDLVLNAITLNNAAGQTASFTSSSFGANSITAEDGAVFNNYGTFLAEADDTGFFQRQHHGRRIHGV